MSSSSCATRGAGPHPGLRADEPRFALGAGPHPGRPVAALLVESFEALAAELPAAHARMCARLAGRVVELRIDDERLVVAFAEGCAHVRAGGETPAADVRVVTSRQAILDVLDARRSLSDAVFADEIEVVGTLEHLVEAHAGLTTYLHGAVRTRSFAGLLRRFREMGAPCSTPSEGEPSADDTA